MYSKKPVYFFITLLGILFFIPLTGHFHLFDWDEINFAESAREMIVSGNYTRVQIGFEPFWEKPPLFIWLQVLCMKVFGINEFAARLPNALCGIVTLNVLYYLGLKLRNHFAAIFWVLAYGASLAPALYFRSGIIDPVFNLFIFLAIYQLYKSETGKADKLNIRIHWLYAGIFSGLAVLTKGPVALLIIGLVFIIRLILNPRNSWTGWFNTFMALVVCLIITSAWVLPEVIQHGTGLFTEFFNYQVQLFKGQMDWHNQPWFYHIIILLLLCFPASIFALPQLIRSKLFSGEEKIWAQYMRILFWVVLILFSLVSTKIIHYSSLCWFPLSWFAGNALYMWHTRRGKIPGWMKIPIVIVVLIFAITTMVLPLLFAQTDWLGTWVANLKLPALDKILAQPSQWMGWEWAVGLVFLMACIFWLVRSGATKGLHPAFLFLFTGIFSVLVSTWIIPPVEQSLQGAYIKEIRRLSHQNVYTDVWGFKSYAHFYYGNMQASQMYGPWSENSKDYKQFPNPNSTARQFWLMDKAVNKPVYIFTRSNFKPDWYFTNKFQLKKQLGAYILWQRMKPGEPDMRIQP